MVAVKFLKAYGLWNSAEIAGFLPEKAERLIEDGYAVRVVDSVPEVKAPEAGPKKPRKPVSTKAKDLLTPDPDPEE